MPRVFSDTGVGARSERASTWEERHLSRVEPAVFHIETPLRLVAVAAARHQ
jgi:hypothetical protein